MVNNGDRSWVVVADASRARILGNTEDRYQLSELEDFLNPDGRLHERELTSDLPGRRRGASGTHAVEEGSTKKVASANGLADQIADYLDKGRTDGAFQRLYLIAAPQFLGRLRDKLNEPTRRMIVDTVDKEFTRSSVADIRKLLPRKF